MKMVEIENVKHWRLEIDADRIAWLAFDKEGAGTNVLSGEVLMELNVVLDRLLQESPDGVVIRSAKKSGFIAGADISEFTKLKNSQEAMALIQKGQAVFDRIEALPFPSLALIHGFCLGGGLELSLACTYRVADDSSKTRLGLPEVKLGIHPGFGGSVRLPLLIGAPAAMDLMLTGRTLDSKRARNIGIVDFIVPSRHLLTAGAYYMKNRRPRKPLPFLKRITNHGLVRPILKQAIVRNVKKKARKNHYPAPYALINLWTEYGGARKRMMVEEARSVSNLVTGSTAQNLVRVFFLNEKLKSLGRGSQFSAKHVHVVGAGTMGGDIASWCALRGLNVTLQDREAKFIAPAMKRAYALFKKRLRKPELVQAAMDRLTPDVNGSVGIPKADVVIEAIFENVEAKQELFKAVEAKARPDTLLATNTSSIPLEDISKALQNPGRLVGLHFFNPVAMMPLVEVVAGKESDEGEVVRAMTFARQIDRLPLPVKSGPGFLVNRVLMPYLMEAVLLKGEGVPPEIIDRAALEFGMPMGPIFLADTVGLDICLHVAEILSQTLGTIIPEELKELVQKGHLGKKSGKGFYSYKGGKKVASKVSAFGGSIKDVTDRLILSMVNECVACLQDGIVDNADLLDAGVIFGTGFAPFRGGPMQTSRARGIGNVKVRLEELEKSFGERFRPREGLEFI